VRYLCQVWFDGKKLDTMSTAEQEKLDRDSLAYDEKLERDGSFIAAEALQGPSSAVTVRMRSGKMSVTDGPFIETKEHLGGFILIEAPNMDKAIEIAAGIPLAKLGAIEVRPIYIIPGSEA